MTITLPTRVLDEQDRYGDADPRQIETSRGGDGAGKDHAINRAGTITSAEARFIGLDPGK